MLISYKRGQGSIVLRVKILNSSVSTGAGLTALTSASAGLIISTIADNEATAVAYTQAGSTIESITTLGTYAAPTATKCRFKEVDATNHKGVYEIQLADTRFAGGKSLLVSISGATNCAETDACVPLTDLDPYDVVRAGLTAIPNAVAGANAGLPVLSVAGTTLGYTVSTVTTLTNLPAITANWLTAAGIASGALVVAVWDGSISGHTGAGTFGAALNAAGSAGDPWSTPLPGAYGAGTAGFIVGTNLNATITSRMATYTQPTGFLAANFPAAIADEILIIAATNAIMTRLGTPAASVSADIAAVKVDTAAVKAKTDQLTFTVALSVDATASVAAASVRSAIGMASANMDTQLAAILAASGSGGGAIAYTITVTDNSAVPLDGAEVWVTTDSTGTNVIAGAFSTTAMGIVTFQLDVGSYFVWVSHSGYNGNNPFAITVT